jgi:hypothetical protein
VFAALGVVGALAAHRAIRNLRCATSAARPNVKPVSPDGGRMG